ncbi:hypothetical protein PsorP6_010677 [Peronosclerospora sorghi]|uniref:Uncharacterized protein n=1 Tax=Peronosclerospora sorghi TaxID=230839 RepID=A0ACC0VWZ7_9STRA|nr:hypothetical protein PsorP6_010677 [Peronosclerospora sorghi]
MKFRPTSWTPDVLPSIDLSREEQEKYRVLATQLLSNTLRDYDIYSSDPRQRHMSGHRWKPIKRIDHLTVYKERYPNRNPRASFMDRVSTAFRGNEWTEPKLLVATGWLEGTLDDVMYGVTSPNAPTMLLKATVVKNRLVNGAVLASIDTPCLADPFRFLGVKWFVKAPHTALHGIVQPRDLVVIEATGITTRPNGERIGYQLLHSVDLPHYRTLTPRLGIHVTRGRISSCSIFREIPAGLGSRQSKVDVYVKGYVEAHGKLLDSVALAAASTGFSSCWNAVECANLKKLMWCFRQFRDRPSLSFHCSRFSTDYLNTSPLYPPLPESSSSTCGTCSKVLRTLVPKSARACAMCSRTTCSRCRVVRTLKQVNTELWLRQETVGICKRCILQVDRLAAEDVARAEVQGGWTGALENDNKQFTSITTTPSSGQTTTPYPSVSVSSPTAEFSVDSFRGVEPILSSPAQADERADPDAVKSDREHREQIWSQMVELRMVAESIYKLAQETTKSFTSVPYGT